MSKNLDEPKLRRMVQKYRKFKSKCAAQGRESGAGEWLERLIDKCQQCWCSIIPPCVRDFRNEYEQFDYFWRAEMGKPCSSPLVSTQPLEKMVRKYKVGDPVVLGLVYNVQSIKKVLNFINHLRQEELKSELIICPINTEGPNYRTQIQPKIILFQDTVAIFWRGLFDEMILLSKLRMQDAGLVKAVKAEVAARVEYEGKIREMAETGTYENNSQVLM